MNYEQLSVERDDHVAVVTFDRPECKNALSEKLMGEITAVANAFQDDVAARVVIFTGRGDTFTAGADLRDAAHAERARGPNVAAWRRLRVGPNMIRAVHSMSQITIAAIDGFALGGGACIASACDFRIASERAKIGYPEIDLGMNLSWVSLPLAVHLVGPARAKRMLLLGRHESAATLREWGFVDEVVSVDRMHARARELADELAGKPALAAQMIKRGVNAVSSALDAAIMHMDTDQYMLATESEEHAEAIRAFVERHSRRRE